MQVEYYLIKPVQRITKYGILVTVSLFFDYFLCYLSFFGREFFKKLGKIIQIMFY